MPALTDAPITMRGENRLASVPTRAPPMSGTMRVRPTTTTRKGEPVRSKVRSENANISAHRIQLTPAPTANSQRNCPIRNGFSGTVSGDAFSEAPVFPHDGPGG